jgi:hypothetical protein
LPGGGVRLATESSRVRIDRGFGDRRVHRCGRRFEMAREEIVEVDTP